MKRLSLLLVPALLLAACQSTPDTIKIGFIGPLTGEASPYGADTLHGVQMKVDEINAAGGIKGKQVQLVAEDGKCSGAESTAAAQKLVNIDKVIAIVGGQCSGETLAAAPIAEAGKVVMVSPISSSPDVTKAGTFIFRDYPSDALKTGVMAGLFQEEGYTKVGIISENTDFCQGFRDSLIEDLPEGAVIFNESVEPGTKDYRTLLTRMKDSGIEVFVANAQTPAGIAAMLQQMKELGIDVPVYSHDVADSKELITLAPEALGKLSVISVPDAGKDTPFEQQFVTKYGTPEQTIGFTAFAYDAAGVILKTIESVGTDGTAIRDALLALPSYEGVIGTFSFDANGDVEGVSYVLKAVQNGAFVTLRPLAM